jgi:hypothetical protein
LAANASAGVTNVEYFAGSTSLGSATVSPFSVSGNIANPGPYALTAVATAGGLSATSGIVNITIVASQPPLVLFGSAISNGVFSFKYNATAGSNYVIEASSNLLSWNPLITNTAASSTESFSESTGSSPRFYKVGRVP